MLAQDLQWGFYRNLAVPGDYDGDGIWDLAVFGPEQGMWWIETLDETLLAWDDEWGFESAAPVGGAFARGGSRVAHICDEEYLGSFGRLTSIAVDNKDQPHVAVDGSQYVCFYDRVDRAWQSLTVDITQYSASGQYYNPHIEIDRADRAWVSGILCCGETGLGYIVRTDVASNPSAENFSRKHIDLTSWDTGIHSLDIFGDYSVGSSSRGYWQKFTYDAAAEGCSLDGDRGQMYAGDGGEKNVFSISRATTVEHADGTVKAVWHGATAGCSFCPGPHDSAYQNSYRLAQGLDIVPWAYWESYDLGDDHNYPWIVPDRVEPQRAYILQDVYGLGIVLNIWDGTQMVWDPSALPHIPDAEVTSRFAPQAGAAAGGGIFVAWSQGGTVWLRHVGPDGTMGADVEVGPGNKPALVTDRQGTLHLTYINGGTCYRRILTY